MHVAVLGAGVVGVTTAHFLSRAGHQVTLVERESSVAQGCSFANGCQLSYSYTDAMASPALLARMPLLLAGADPAILIRPRIDADLLRWAFDFLAECTTAKAQANTLANLRLAVRSKQLLQELRLTLDADFGFRDAGKLILLRSEKERRDAQQRGQLKSDLGVTTRVVDLDEAISIEPGIARMTGPYVAAIHSRGDDIGDPHTFTTALAAQLQSRPGCEIRMSTQVQGILTERNRVRAVVTDNGNLDVDSTVVCMGAWSPQILRPIGIDSGIVPARGYSVTLKPGRHAASVSVTDFGKRFVISRIGELVRIAGFADFVGHNTKRDPQRITRLLQVARNTAPEAANYESLPNHAWGGFRPLTADGLPRIGPTTIGGLYLNTGHGSLGWTLACASAEKVVAAITPEQVLGKSLAA